MFFIPTNIVDDDDDIINIAQDLTDIENALNALEDQVDINTAAIAALTPTSYISTTNVTNSQMRATTDISVVTSPGGSTMITPIAIQLIPKYGGTNAWVGSSNIYVTIGGVLCADISTITWIGTADYYKYSNEFTSDSNTISLMKDKDIIINFSAGLTGNAANDNTMTVIVYYMLTNV